MSSLNLTDPLLPSQWYLINTGQRGGDSRLDINVLPAWQAGFNGAGIVVAINDDGIDLTHPDLVANIDASRVYDANRGTTGQGFVGTDNSHGTVVGSIVGMAANGIGGVGVAYKATLVPSLAIGTDAAFASANLFKSNIAARVDVSVNSWGVDPAFAENFGASGTEEDRAWGAELLRAATEGRNGLGIVIEVSAGNDQPYGDAGVDYIVASLGNDTFHVSQQVDWVFEQPGEGTDTVIADSPNGHYLYSNSSRARRRRTLRWLHVASPLPSRPPKSGATKRAISRWRIWCSVRPNRATTR